MRKGEGGSSNSQSPKKLKFVPKIPSRKARKRTVANEEPSESYHEVVGKELVLKIQRATMGSGLLQKTLSSDRKAVAQTEVAFGHVDSKFARSFPKGKAKVNQAEVNEIQDIDDGEIIPKIKSHYVDPWDYENSYYPVTLPLRRPYSGNPEILDKEEFGEASAPVALNCSKISPAEELGLMQEKSAAKRMFLFQFPPTLPSVKKPAADGASRSTGKLEKQFTNGCKLEDLPEGLIGKIMVHRSGKMKMKLGDSFFDVYPGVKCDFAQQVAAINVKEKHCCVLGEPGKRVVVTPDVDSLVNAI
ncbi:uncharacterized protein LOC122036036 isoform X1 [Zingiber officinale]|uniref:uncharacterized protein LOC122036036 isoform X1 n=1 Tax=Zingiber officinale TaxID=94328 RepID=UPI001C4A9C19|nr:uncharacterized protein LOC122036036 isoform X1 [Zingiber officinale]XP_042451143.1 uncharacterized protein LOC122036036 isoform X1 [Zingiber officinale]XP_042451144.1 uncharacterized protein LOC122036036 isoform X1 [Zingiber officinale]